MVSWVLFLLLLGESSSTASSTSVHSCFYLVGVKMNQTEARKVCRTKYMDLVTVSSEEDNTKLAEMLNKSDAKDAWIGLHRGEAKERWSNGDPVIFKILTGDTGLLDWCAAFKADCLWERITCTTTKYFMCYKQDGSSQTPTYHVILEGKTWYEAQSYCRKNYTDLVSIRDQQHNNMVFEVGKRNNADSFWIGLLEQKWHWVDERNSDYRNWDSNQPQTSFDCVQLSESKKWHSVSCNNSLPALCYSNYIHVSDEALNWEKALDYCQQGNRTGLLIIDSQANQNDVEAELRKRNISEPVWVGLKQSQLFGFWIWANKAAVFPYSNWDEGKQPEHLLSEHCGAVIPQNGFQWKDKNCQAEYRALCHITCSG